MKPHFLRVAVGVLTFIVGWSISTVNFNSSCKRVRAPSKPSSAWALLLSLQDRDLTKIEGDEQAQLETAIESLRGKVENQFLDARLFSRVSNNSGEQRYVLIEESPLIIIPGKSSLRISLFGPGGELINSSEFGTGWRIGLSKVRFIQVKDIRGEVLEVESYPAINGPDVARQYYALIRDKMRLIRLEDSSRALIPNVYISTNFTIGLTQTGLAAAEWEKALLSSDVAEVLATLTWLGGRHLNVEEEGDLGHSHEKPSEARMVEEVRTRPAVKEAVDALKSSDNPWVRDAASAVNEMHLKFCRNSVAEQASELSLRTSIRS